MPRWSHVSATMICGLVMIVAQPILAQPSTPRSSPEDSPPAATAPAAAPIPAGWGRYGKPLYYFMVFSNPTPGQEEEFNRWYDGVHAPVMIETGDFIWTQRFVLSPTQFAGGGTPALTTRQYLVIFAIETDDISKVVEDVSKRMRLPRNIASRSLDYNSLQSATWMAISPPTSQEQAQRMMEEEERAGRVPSKDERRPQGFDPFAGMSAPVQPGKPPTAGAPIKSTAP